jgi:hypothetical protein
MRAKGRQRPKRIVLTLQDRERRDLEWLHSELLGSSRRGLKPEKIYNIFKLKYHT